jgi:hypothetical protein
MTRPAPDLAVVAAGALVCAALVLLVPVEALKVVGAVPLCLVLPGYAICAAGFARLPADRWLLLLLTLAMSLVTLILGALILDRVPGDISRTTWTVLLVVVVLGGCAVAGFRRPARGGDPGRPRLRPGVGIAEVALVGAACAAVFITTAELRRPLPAPNVVGYTQVWMLPAGGTREPEVTIGVKSGEIRTRAYRLDLEVGNVGTVLRRRFVLRPGTSVRLRARPQTRSGASPTSVTALLYRLDRPGVYRRVRTWIPAR